MKLDYIYHSGFAIEADGVTVMNDTFIIFRFRGIFVVIDNDRHSVRFNREAAMVDVIKFHLRIEL